MTFAGSFQTPTIFICTNNQYAISVPVKKQNGTTKFVDKAIGYGIPGVAVDGNDILAVYSVMKEAVEKARRGGGPTMIECVTFRMGPHSSSDDPTRYRDEDLYNAWKKRDPIQRFKEYLTRKKLWDDKQEAKLQEQIKQDLMAAIEKTEKEPNPAVETMFEDVYESLTPQLEKQKKALLEEQELRGKFINNSVAFPL
jgi:TPP-dependent pyruvate/acetoin dehydrogenase alpha subunit